ncbi:trypsin domain-containing protein [Ditylenchus destructor]|nr:trypsin domain-containing protein [Ditylenchus destructor]
MRFVLQTHAILLLSACVASVPHRDSKSENECGISDYDFGQRILGGKDAPPKKWPWMVALELRGEEFCTGSIISKRFILTAAHCRFDEDGNPVPISDIRVRAGSVNRSEAKQMHVHAFQSHPDFLESETYIINDIGVIQLKEEIDFDSNARPICLGNVFVERNNTPAVIAGWGRTIAEKYYHPKILQEGTAEFVEYEPCKKAYLVPLPGEPGPEPKLVKEQHICALGTNKSDTWKGDSGGPLFAKSEKDTGSKVRWVQHGVCSYSSAVHHDGLPAVFSRVTTFCDWIKETTKGEAECTDF